MRTHIVLLILCITLSYSYGQKLELEKASPFTAVKWENEKPIVQFENDWYTLEKLDKYTTEEILAFCKNSYGVKWQKRFSEDLVEVLKKMGTHPNIKVTLLLSGNSPLKKAIGTYTYQNRQKVLEYSRGDKQKPIQQFKRITKIQAIKDIEQFQQILEEKSSYVHIANYDYKNAINSLKASIKTFKKDVNVNYLTYELAKIMSEIGDRHSIVKNKAFEKEEHTTYNMQLPFSIASLKGKALALKRINKQGVYAYLYAEYPYVKSINGMPITVMVDSLVYKSKKAPKEVKLRRGVSEIQQLGKLYFVNNLKLPKQIEIVFTNGATEKKAFVQLQNERFRYYSKLERDTYLKSRAIKKGDFAVASKVLKGNIGYVSLPKMYHYEEITKLKGFIDTTFSSFLNTKALIIDLRFNPGGGRDLIKTIGAYIIPQSASPWVANVAYLRTNKKGMPHESMSNRFLYKYSSPRISNLKRRAVDTFTENFTTHRKFDSIKFSEAHYMLLESGKQHYSKPVYILVNERSFSAATVFISAFKGLPNVKIVGVRTDGSSGNSKSNKLKHSNISVKISTMLSFQRNGRTLDGNGTKPDIYIPEDETQILKGKDVQLKQLTKIINSSKS